MSETPQPLSNPDSIHQATFLARMNHEPARNAENEKHGYNLVQASRLLDRAVQAGDNFNEGLLKSLQALIIRDHKHISIFHRGEYCLRPKQVINPPTGTVAPFLDFMQIPEEMTRFTHDAAKALKIPEGTEITDVVQALDTAANIHWRFVYIHPFADGNGRLARLLTDRVLMSHGLLPIPRWTDGKDGKDPKPENRLEYYRAVQASISASDNTPLMRFLATRELEALDIEENVIIKDKRAMQNSVATHDWDRRQGIKQQIQQYLQEPLSA